MEQIQEIEKEEAVRARKELFEQRKQQKNKIVQLAGQVATVSMVSEWGRGWGGGGGAHALLSGGWRIVPMACPEATTMLQKEVAV